MVTERRQQKKEEDLQRKRHCQFNNSKSSKRRYQNRRSNSKEICKFYKSFKERLHPSEMSEWELANNFLIDGRHSICDNENFFAEFKKLFDHIPLNNINTQDVPNKYLARIKNELDKCYKKGQFLENNLLHTAVDLIICIDTAVINANQKSVYFSHAKNILSLLIKAGVDVNQKDKMGRTPIDLFEADRLLDKFFIDYINKLVKESLQQTDQSPVSLQHIPSSLDETSSSSEAMNVCH